MARWPRATPPTVAGTLDVDVSAYPRTPATSSTSSPPTTRAPAPSRPSPGHGFTVNYLPNASGSRPPTLTITDRRVDEPDTGTTNARFEVDLSSPSAGTVTVDYATADGSAQGPRRLHRHLGHAHLHPRPDPAVHQRPGPRRPARREPTRPTSSTSPRRRWPRSPTTRASGGSPTTTRRRRSRSTTPPRTRAGTEILNVSLSAPSSLPVTVNYATAHDTATSPADYPTKTGTVTINPGKTHKTVRIPTTQDVLDEADETFNVNLSGPTNATIADAHGPGDDPRQRPGPVAYDRRRLAQRGRHLRLHGHALGRQAASRSVSTTTPSTAPPPPPATTPPPRTTSSSPPARRPGRSRSPRSTTLTVEPDETFSVHLSAPIKATIADADGTGTIVNND